MLRRAGQILLLFTILTLLCGVGSATQITIGESTNGGLVQFTGTTTSPFDIAVDFSGSCSGLVTASRCLSGLGLYSLDVGKYAIWLTGPSLALDGTGGPFDIYPVIQGTTVVHFEFEDTVTSDVLSGTWALTFLVGASTRAPEFIGEFTNDGSSTGVFAGPNWQGPVDGDFSVNLSRGTVNDVYATHNSTTGPLSSGELLPTPEPGTLGLLGSGLLAVLSAVQRRLS